MERDEHHAVPAPAHPRREVEGAAGGGHPHEVALGHTEPVRVRTGQLDPGTRCRLVQGTGPCGLGPGVELVHRAPAHAGERPLGRGNLRGRDVRGVPQERAAVRLRRAVPLGSDRRAGDEVVPEALAHLRVGGEHAVGVQPVTPVGVLLVARPRDSRSRPEFRVRQSCVVTQPAAGALLPRLEGALRIAPPDQRTALVVPQVHPPGVVQEDVQIAARRTGWVDGLVREVHGPVHVGVGALLLAPERRGQHHVGVLGGLGAEPVLHHHEQVRIPEDVAHPAQVRQGHRRVRARDPEEPDRALLRVTPDLHGVRRLGPVRDPQRVDPPQPRQLAHVFGIVPVAEAGEITVGPALAGVLGGRLAVHLQHPAPRPADPAGQQVQVVHLAGRGRGLVRLVEALQHRGQDPVRGAEDTGGGPHVVGIDPADPGDPFGRVLAHRLGELVETERVRVDVVAVQPPLHDDLAHQPVQQRLVGARQRCQVHPTGAFCGLGHRRAPRVDGDDTGRVGARNPVEHAGPQHRLGLRHVVPEAEQCVTTVDVGVAAGLAVRAEALLHRGRRGRGAQPGVAVHVRGAEATLSEHGEGVVLLQEELAGRVEAVRQRPHLVEQLPGPADDALHRGVPVGRDEFAALAHQGAGQPVGPAPPPRAVEPLRAEPAVVDHVPRHAAHAHHPTTGDGDVARAPVAAQHARGPHPTLHVVLGDPVVQVCVHAHGPGGVPGERRPGAPHVADAVHPCPVPAQPTLARRHPRVDPFERPRSVPTFTAATSPTRGAPRTPAPL